jgi:hypothetical protein
LTLKEIFEYLTYGELANLPIGNLVGEEISPDHYQQIISYINLGVKELYKRFWLSSNELFIRLNDDIEFYELSREYAQQNGSSTKPDRYILDSADNLFTDGILEIERVFDEDRTELPLNDLNDDDSLFTPTYKTLQVPPAWREEHDDVYLIVHYRKVPPKITYVAGMDPADVTIDIPEGLLEALLAYVGYRAYIAVGGPEAQQEAMLHQQRFETSCTMAQAVGIGITTGLTNLKLDNNQWV